jgi:uncharacterized protein (DUF433 family)
MPRCGYGPRKMVHQSGQWCSVRMVPSRIVIDPTIQHGKPVIRGTRVSVVRILSGLAGGTSTDEVMQEYEVTQEDI